MVGGGGCCFFLRGGGKSGLRFHILYRLNYRLTRPSLVSHPDRKNGTSSCANELRLDCELVSAGVFRGEARWEEFARGGFFGSGGQRTQRMRYHVLFSCYGRRY